MNFKRTLLFGVLMWVFIFIIISILMFLPFLQGKEMTQNVVYWVLLIPLTLLLAKWYFKMDPPTLKKGFLLGVAGLVVGTILDLAITVPLFVGPQQGGYVAGLNVFYTAWEMYVGFAILLASTTFAGFEFDGTFTKQSKM